MVAFLSARFPVFLGLRAPDSMNPAEESHFVNFSVANAVKTQKGTFFEQIEIAKPKGSFLAAICFFVTASKDCQTLSRKLSARSDGPFDEELVPKMSNMLTRKITHLSLDSYLQPVFERRQFSSTYSEQT